MLVSIQQLETLSTEEIQTLADKLRDIWMKEFQCMP